MLNYADYLDGDAVQRDRRDFYRKKVRETVENIKKKKALDEEEAERKARRMRLGKSSAIGSPRPLTILDLLKRK